MAELNLQVLQDLFKNTNKDHLSDISFLQAIRKKFDRATVPIYKDTLIAAREKYLGTEVTEQKLFNFLYSQKDTLNITETTGLESYLKEFPKQQAAELKAKEEIKSIFESYKGGKVDALTALLGMQKPLMQAWESGMNRPFVQAWDSGMNSMVLKSPSIVLKEYRAAEEKLIPKAKEDLQKFIVKAYNNSKSADEFLLCFQTIGMPKDLENNAKDLFSILQKHHGEHTITDDLKTLQENKTTWGTIKDFISAFIKAITFGQLDLGSNAEVKKETQKKSEDSVGKLINSTVKEILKQEKRKQGHIAFTERLEKNQSNNSQGHNI